MTSEGQYAGPQPAEATSGGPASGGHPSDAEGHRVSGRASAPAPADGSPSSYAPPPPVTPSGGSPFVVPAVPTRPSAGTSYGSARVPQPDDGGSLPQRTAASPYGPVSPDSAASSYGPVAPGSAPRPAAGSASPFGGSPGQAPEEPRFAWAPPQPPPAADTSQGLARRGEPLPQRNPSIPPDPGEFDGFAAAASGRATVGDRSGAGRDEIDPATGRPPGVSAFGDQRVRVPGATLANLPDAPPPGRSAESGGFPLRRDNGGLPTRAAGSARFPTRRGETSGFPVRGGFAPDADAPSQPRPPQGLSAPDAPGHRASAQVTPDLSSRGRQGPFASPPAPPAGQAGSGQPDSGGLGSGQSGEPTGGASGSFNAFGRQPGGESPSRGLPDPFGRGDPGESAADAPARFGGSATAPSFGPSPSSGSAAPGDARSASVFGPSADKAPSEGSAPSVRPEGVFGPSASGGSAADEQHPFGRLEPPAGADGESSGFVRRVPGASLGAPVNGAVPQPRDPAEHPATGSARPATGSARPVTASASVPSASRAAPVDPGELPPPSASPQARVYGRPAAAEPEEDRSGEPPPLPHRERDQRSGFGTGSPAGPRPGGEPDQRSGFGTESPFGRRPGAEPEQRSGFGPFSGESPFGPRPDGRPGPAGFGSPALPSPGDDRDVSGVVPQSPARATARASASARVAPPTPAGLGFSAPSRGPGTAPAGPDQPHSGPPFTEFTTDVAQRGGGPGTPGTAPALLPEQYTELTTDIAGREAPGSPYGPEAVMPYSVPGQPAPDATAMRMGGAFPGSPARATVTPPPPDDTTNWPGSEQSRFDQFRPEAEAAPAAKPETPHVRMLPILVAVVVGSVLLLGVVFGLVYLIAGRDDALTVSTGDCVKPSGKTAVKADCGDAASFQVVSIVDDKSECPDPRRPYVVNPTGDGKNQVLCLKPQS